MLANRYACVSFSIIIYNIELRAKREIFYNFYALTLQSIRKKFSSNKQYYDTVAVLKRYTNLIFVKLLIKDGSVREL